MAKQSFCTLLKEMVKDEKKARDTDYLKLIKSVWTTDLSEKEKNRFVGYASENREDEAKHWYSMKHFYDKHCKIKR